MNMTKKDIIRDQDESVAQLDQQINESINHSQLESVEVLSVVMEKVFSLFSETEGHLAEMKFMDSAGENHRFTLRLETPLTPGQTH